MYLLRLSQSKDNSFKLDGEFSYFKMSVIKLKSPDIAVNNYFPLDFFYFCFFTLMLQIIKLILISDISIVWE